MSKPDDQPEQVLPFDKDRLAFELNSFKEFRDYVKHEDGLIIQRSTLYFATQTVLVAVVGFTAQKFADVVFRPGAGELPGLNAFVTNYSRFLAVLACLGVVLSLSYLASLRAAIVSLRGLSAAWPCFRAQQRFELHMPALRGGGQQRWYYRFTFEKVLPWAFTLAWLLLSVQLIVVRWDCTVEGRCLPFGAATEVFQSTPNPPSTGEPDALAPTAN
jgi:hypothetical protein